MDTDLLQNALERWDGWELGDPFDAGTLDVILEAARLYQNLIGQGLRQELSVSSQRWITDWAALTRGDTDEPL